jgi:hypothetical protein
MLINLPMKNEAKEDQRVEETSGMILTEQGMQDT